MKRTSRSVAQNDGSPSAYTRTKAVAADSAAPGVDDVKTIVSDDVAPSGRRVATGAQIRALKLASASTTSDGATSKTVLKVHGTPRTGVVSRRVPRGTP